MLNKQFDYEGNTITFESGDGSVMVNATQMAKVFDKKPNDWLRLPSTEEFIQALNGVRKSPNDLNSLIMSDARFSRFDDNQLVTTKKGGYDQGTWFHEDLALEFARWLSPTFAIWCNTKIKELLTQGQTSIGSNDEDAFILQAFEMLQQRVNCQSEELQKQAPKVEYYNEVLQSTGVYTTQQIAKELGMSAISLNKLLYEKKIQYKQSDTWMLYHAYQDKGYTKTKTHTYIDEQGRTQSRMHMVWTEAGRRFIHDKLKKGLQVSALENGQCQGDRPAYW